MSETWFRGARRPRLLGLGLLGLVWACSGGKSSSNDTSGSGAESGWTYLPPGSDVMSPPSGGAGAAGASAGSGPAGSGGASSAGVGGVSLPPLTFKCGGIKPTQPIITSFDGFKADRWVSPGNLNGGVYVYPDPLAPTSGEFLGFDGPVKDYTGMGVWFAGCIDASKFKGVRFTVSGDAGPTGKVRFYLITNSTKEVNEADSVGACIPADPNDGWASCRPPGMMLAISSTPTTESVPWTAFKDGRPGDVTNGGDVIALQWSFDWSEGQQYPAKLVVDNLSFYTDPDPGGGGTGGQPGGGSGSGGQAAGGGGTNSGAAGSESGGSANGGGGSANGGSTSGGTAGTGN